MVLTALAVAADHGRYQRNGAQVLFTSGPAEMVPGQHHLRMNMYIAQARKGVFEIEQSLGAIDPKECGGGV